MEWVGRKIKSGSGGRDRRRVEECLDILHALDVGWTWMGFVWGVWGGGSMFRSLKRKENKRKKKRRSSSRG